MALLMNFPVPRVPVSPQHCPQVFSFFPQVLVVEGNRIGAIKQAPDQPPLHMSMRVIIFSHWSDVSDQLRFWSDMI